MIPECSGYKGNRISPLQFVILALLRGRSMYGYEILKRLRELYEGVWSPKTGSLYPSLRRLEEHGLVWSEEREGVSYYSLTAEGEEWTERALRSLPMDVAMASRWFMRTLKEASRTPEEASEGLGFGQEDFNNLLRKLIDREHQDVASKLEHLRLMKERMRGFIEEIEKLEKELEMEERQ